MKKSDLINRSYKANSQERLITPKDRIINFGFIHMIMVPIQYLQWKMRWFLNDTPTLTPILNNVKNRNN